MTKTPPHSEAAEQSVLGAMLISDRAALDIVDRLSAKDFYQSRHVLIFTAVTDLMAAGIGHDQVTVIERLRAKGELEDAGGLKYLYDLASDTPGAANARHYAKTVRDHAQMREVIAAGWELAELGYHPEERTPEEVLEVAERRITEARESGTRAANQAHGYDTLMPEVEERIESAKSGTLLQGLGSGISHLDRLTNGFHAGDLVIIGGRPGMGKTILGLNIAEHVALVEAQPVLVFSMEMSRQELATRSIASQSRIDLDNLRTGHLTEEEWQRFAASGGSRRRMPIHIDDTGALSPLELRARARRHKLRHGLGMIVVDYIQLMQSSDPRENRTNQISEISRSLKALAKELSVPVVAISQLSRAVEQRDQKRPKMSDLRDSGGLEQDADLILFVYRAEYYDAESADRGVGDIIVAKQRNGPQGTVKAAFSGPFCRFDNLAHDYVPYVPAPKAETRGFKAPVARSYAEVN